MDYFAALRSFVRTAELRSFSRAALDLDVKVSTVSRHVAFLEDDLKAALLNRSTHRLHLTEIGQMFLDNSRQVVRDLDEARSTASGFNQRPQGLLRFTAPSAFGRLHIVPHLPAFLSSYTTIRTDMVLTDQHLDLIDTGMDLAIRIGTLTDSLLVAKKLASHERILCAAPRYLAANAPLERPSDLMLHQVLIFHLGQGMCQLTHRASRERVEVQVAGRYQTNDSEALLALALAGEGVAALPNWMVGEHLRRGTLVAPLLDWSISFGGDPNLNIWAVYPPKRIVSPKVKAFIQFLEDRFRAAPF